MDGWMEGGTGGGLPSGFMKPIARMTRSAGHSLSVPAMGLMPLADTSTFTVTRPLTLPCKGGREGGREGGKEGGREGGGNDVGILDYRNVTVIFTLSSPSFPRPLHPYLLVPEEFLGHD